MAERLDLVPEESQELSNTRGLGFGKTYSTTRGTSEERDSVTWLARGVARVKRFRYLQQCEKNATGFQCCLSEETVPQSEGKSDGVIELKKVFNHFRT